MTKKRIPLRVSPSWVILVRNPSTQNVIIISEGDNYSAAQYESEWRAEAAAHTIPICRAWSYSVVRVS